MQEKSMLSAVKQIPSKFDPNVIAIICTIRCNIHTISNTFARYVHPLSKNEKP